LLNINDFDMVSNGQLLQPEQLRDRGIHTGEVDKPDRQRLVSYARFSATAEESGHRQAPQGAVEAELPPQARLDAHGSQVRVGDRGR
jgi:hypothetical protein